MTISDNQAVGQLLTLQCEVTTVRGITSRVDIVWSSDGTVLRRIYYTIPSLIINSSAVYIDNYTILQLNTNDNDRVIQCEAAINASSSVTASDSITLSVIGKCNIVMFSAYLHYVA